MLGEEMVLTGRLPIADEGLGIELDDGVIWYLVFKIRVHQFIGPKVKVRGVRIAFDRLDASYIESL
ncbi:MAG: hypothetical protein JWR77_1545 [Rhizorhabdus sp.]|nr:hypothetical protein [Rhizorhabdus sp.]